MMTPTSKAAHFIKNGLYMVPLKQNSKEPYLKDYLEKIFSEEDFSDVNNIALNVKKSGTTFADMDSREAERMAKYFFPQTYGTFVEGLRTHWTYKGIVTETARKFPDGKTIAELRSGGIQVIAPSVAPAKLFNNKLKERTDNQHPIVDAPDDLIERYNKTCFAALCLKYIDSNNLPFVKITQSLMHYTDWSQTEREHFVKALADECKPDTAFDWKDIKAKFKSAENKYNDKKSHAFGYKALAEEFKISVSYMKTAIEWIGSVKEETNTRKTIIDFYDNAVSAAQLKKKIERRYLVGEILPERGLVNICGRPKGGKSNLTLDLAYALQNAHSFLGIPTGIDGVGYDVLLLALEDDEDSITLKIQEMKVEDFIRPTIYAKQECPCIGKGLEESIIAWKQNVGKPKVVIIDTFQKVKPVFSQKNSNAYEMDYFYLSKLHKVALENDLLIIYVHHLAKQTGGNKADYSWDKIMGSVAHQGAVDVMWMLERDEHKPLAVLKGRGRCIADFEYSLKWDRSAFKYYYNGTPKQEYVSRNNKEIFSAMHTLHVKLGAAANIRPEDVINQLSYTKQKDKERVRKNMQRLRDNAELVNGDEYGTYRFSQYNIFDPETGKFKESELY
jgi:hypothetical protein